MDSVSPRLAVAMPLMAPPISRLRLGVPPGFRNAVTPPVRDPLPQLSHVTLAEPYPRPKPIQNPLRRGGYCARAAGAATLSKPAAAKMHAAVRIEPSLEMTPRARRIPCRLRAGRQHRRAVLFRGHEVVNATKARRGPGRFK